MLANDGVVRSLKAWPKRRWILSAFWLIALICILCCVLLSQTLVGIAITPTSGPSQINGSRSKFLIIAVVFSFFTLGFGVGTMCIFAIRRQSIPPQQKDKRMNKDTIHPKIFNKHKYSIHGHGGQVAPRYYTRR